MKPNKLPYNSVEIVCDYLIPGFTTNPLNTIALCDAVLMTFNPGAFLFDTIHQIKKIGIPERPEMIYEIAYSCKFEYDGCTTFEELLTQQSEQATLQLQDYFTTSIFKDNSQWIHDIFSKGKEIRLSEPHFMLEIIKSGRLLNEGQVQNKKLNNIFHALGSPLMINDLFEVVFFLQP